MTDDDEQADAMLHDCCQFVGLVADAAIVGDGCPAAPADFFQPDGIRTIVREVVGVTFDLQAGGGQNFRKAFSEISIGKKDVAHAARS